MDVLWLQHSMDLDFIKLSLLKILHGNQYLYNSALDEGGVVFLLKSNNVYFHNEFFFQNFAVSGGSLLISSSERIFISKKSEFNSSFAKQSGGALYIADSEVQILDVTFFNNSVVLSSHIFSDSSSGMHRTRTLYTYNYKD